MRQKIILLIYKMDSREEKILDTSLKEDIKTINIEGVEYIIFN